MAKKNYAYGGKAVAVMEWLNTEPNATDAHIAKHVGCHATYVKQIRRKMIHAQQEVVKEEVKTPLNPVEKVLNSRSNADEDPLGKLLDKRAEQYGSFMFSANIAIRLKGIMHNAIAQQDMNVAPDQLLALDMIAVKISRLLAGNPSHLDSWVDIAGYAKLVADRLQGTVR